MEVTSVQLKPHGGIINVVGDMGVYGKVYATYELTAGADRSSGTVVGEGVGTSVGDGVGTSVGDGVGTSVGGDDQSRDKPDRRRKTILLRS